MVLQRGGTEPKGAAQLDGSGLAEYTKLEEYGSGYP